MKLPAFAGIVIGALCVIGRAADEPAKSLSVSQASKLVLSAPRPEYPYQAREKKLTGHGLILVRVSAGGSVTSATMQQSSGFAILDHAAIAALKRWRFRPGQAFYYQQPITYTRTGASY
jgi:TonB family protein